MKNKILNLISCLAVIIILSGCQSFNIQNMYPDLDHLSHIQSNKIIKVMDIKTTGSKIKGSHDKIPMIPVSIMKDIDVVTLKKALVHSIEKSEIFDQLVSDDTTCDFRLDSEIISQGQKWGEEDGSFRSALIMKYRLTDEKSGKTIWDDKITSSGKATFSEAFNGSTRANLSLERAIKKNLTKLIKKLSKTQELYI